ncbi:hypothetical protein N9Y60_01095 [Crocinitomicaceae bacterium]|nr:hypothetical protein [Crocinitomicaceae bacterium]
MKKTLIPENLQVTVFAMVVLLLYVVALIYPDNWWGLHYPAFLGGKGWVIVIAAIGFTLYGQKYSFWEGLQGNKSGGNRWVWTFAITIISGVFFYQLPMFEDIYGDAISILNDKELVIKEFTALHKEMILGVDFTNPKLGTDTTLSLVAWISYTREITVYEAFRTLGVICGMGYVFFMLASVYRLAKDSQQRLLFTFLVLGTPLVLGFCGHIEVYAPVYFIIAVFWYVLIRLVEKFTILNTIILLMVCFLHLKLHISGLVGLLVGVMAVAISFRKSKGYSTSWVQIRNFVIAPIILLGICVYVFVTKSVFGPRDYTSDTLTDVIFLPIKSTDPAPLDRYNLFSWNHLFDYFNMFFLWSAIGIVIVIVVLVFRRKQIDWSRPLVQLSALATISFVLLFFVLNPLLAMPKDWDLMSIPALTLIIFSAVLISSMDGENEKERSIASYLINPSIGLFFIAWSAVFVNAEQEPQGERLLSMGKYNFKTYWKGSSTPILFAINLIDDEEKRSLELEKVVKELKPFAVDGNDLEYSGLLNEVGHVYQAYHRDLKAAHIWYKDAYDMFPMNRKAVYDLIYSYFRRGEFDKANDLIPTLVKMKYPNSETPLRMGIHISLEDEDYIASEIYCKELLKVNPKDQFIQKILYLLQNSEDKSQIKLEFSQS